MPEPSLFRIEKSQWDIINGFANWLSAFRSIAAAIVALYLAKSASRPSAVVSVGHSIIIGAGSKPPYPQFAVFKLVNTGERPLRIVQIGWKVGFLRKRYAVQLFDALESSKLPIELAHGQEASWLVPLDALGEPWLEYFAKGMLAPNFRTSLWTLRAQVFTSVGHVFSVRPEENLLKPLQDVCTKLVQEPSSS